MDHESGLEHERVRDHRVVLRVGVLLDVEVLLDGASRVRQERPLCAHRQRNSCNVWCSSVAIVTIWVYATAIFDWNARQIAVLLVLLRAVMATREREDHRIAALELAQRADRFGVVGQ